MNKGLVGLVVLVVVSAGGLLLGCTPPMPPGAPTAAVVDETVDVPVVAPSGDVVADGVVVPIRDAQLGLATGGIVAEVPVAEGDEVEAGQVLVRLDAARQEAAVAQAEAQVARVQNSLAELQAGAHPE